MTLCGDKMFMLCSLNHFIRVKAKFSFECVYVSNAACVSAFGVETWQYILEVFVFPVFITPSHTLSLHYFKHVKETKWAAAETSKCLMIHTLNWTTLINKKILFNIKWLIMTTFLSMNCECKHAKWERERNTECW